MIKNIKVQLPEGSFVQQNRDKLDLIDVRFTQKEVKPSLRAPGKNLNEAVAKILKNYDS